MTVSRDGYAADEDRAADLSEYVGWIQCWWLALPMTIPDERVVTWNEGRQD